MEEALAASHCLESDEEEKNSLTISDEQIQSYINDCWGSDGGEMSEDDDESASPHSPSLSPRVSTVASCCKSSPGSGRKHLSSVCSTSQNPREPIIHTRQRTCIYTAGRPPWYNSQGQLKEAFVIGICGGSASGKTTVATEVIRRLSIPWVTLLSMDSFYKGLSPKELELSEKNEYNFDHPDAVDFSLLIETLRKLKAGKRVEVPTYNFITHQRESKLTQMYGANVVIFEGILAFYNKELLEMMDMKVFVDTDSDLRLVRRLKRDILERGRDIESVLQQYEKHVKPSFDYYIAPSKTHADLIVPRGGENTVAIDLIVRNVLNQLEQRGFKLRSLLAQSHVGQPAPQSLHILPSTPQIQGLHTFIRCCCHDGYSNSIGP